MAAHVSTVSDMFLAQGFGTPSLLFLFGGLLALSVLGAFLTHKIKVIPSITVFMALGFGIGPHGLGLMTTDFLTKADILTDMALGLILFKLGCEVQSRRLLRSASLWRASVTEALLTFGAAFGAMLLFKNSVWASAMVATLALATSPAILVFMAEERQESSPLMDRAKALLSLNNILCFFAFSLLLPFALGETSENLFDFIVIPLYRSLGACLVGLAVAGIASLIDRLMNKEDEAFRFALILGAVALTLGLASMLKVSALLAGLALGMGTPWMDTRRQGLSTVAIGPGGHALFIILFVMAGASLRFDLFATAFAPVALAVVGARWLGKVLALLINRDAPHEKPVEATAISLMLLPMGAMAIGLAQTLHGFVPELGEKVLPAIFAMVTILEVLGPFGVLLAMRLTRTPLPARTETSLN